ncbi:MAG: 4Fe-4S dicluster domain-containing protein, partial [Chloroflexi bacterium]|nr:4Fe-4S dicluster domain-containing protein [Chloroflexota bacterium]
MTAWAASPADARWLPRPRLDELIQALRASGRTVIGPRVVDGAIAMAEVEHAIDLPLGWTASTFPGGARLQRRAAGDPGAVRVFDNGPAWSGIKPWTFPPRIDTLTLEQLVDGALVATEPAATGDAGPATPTAPVAAGPRPIAVIGARACDLAALAIHDRVLIGGPAVDPDYASRRAGLLVVAVECAMATTTCFCASMGTGPEVGEGADVVLSEADGGFVARGATAAGESLLATLDLESAPVTELGAADARVAAARAAMGHNLGVETDGLHDRLLASLDSPRWDASATRCLACTNCTLVCPTCFCTGQFVTSDLDGRASTAARTWDSCFTAGFAQVAGGSFRPK